MTKQEVEMYLEKIRLHKIKVTKSKKTAREFLVHLGTHTKEGKLTPEYQA